MAWHWKPAICTPWFEGNVNQENLISIFSRSISILSQVRPMFLRSTKFCQGLPYFEDAVVLPRSRTNFCHAWNLTDLSICTPWFEGNVNQENLISIFSRSISIRSPPKLFLSYAAIKRWKIEDSYLGMLHNDPYSEYNYYGSQVYFPIASPGLSTVPYISAKVVDSASTSYRISYP